MISSPQNQRVKSVVKLRQRSHRDERGLMIVEGFRELTRALDSDHPVSELFICPELFLGENEPELIDRTRAAGAEVLQCTAPVFSKMAYRDRPEGLLAVAPQVNQSLADVILSSTPLVVIAETIEKPGNLGTILRSADAAGADCVLVCDRCTDISNPNVVRASIGTVFCIPVVETSTAEAMQWLKQNDIQVVAATPHVEAAYTSADLSRPTALVIGSEQYGLTKEWLDASDLEVRIPMHGVADSLNVAAAATILLFEAVRQRTGETNHG